MIVLLANGEISHITSNENFKVIVTEICSYALFRFFSATPCTQDQNSMVNFPLSDTLFDDLAYFFIVSMFHSKPQRKKENRKGSAKTKTKKTRKLKNLFVLCLVNKLFRSYPIPSLQQLTIQKVSMLFFLSFSFFLFFPFFFLYSTTVSNCINYPQILFPLLNVIL